MYNHPELYKSFEFEFLFDILTIEDVTVRLVHLLVHD